MASIQKVLELDCLCPSQLADVIDSVILNHLLSLWLPDKVAVRIKWINICKNINGRHQKAGHDILVSQPQGCYINITYLVSLGKVNSSEIISLIK